MLEIIRNAWKIPDLKRKILFSVGLLLIFRLGSFVPVPGLNAAALQKIAGSGGVFDFLNILSGGAFKMATIFAMSITPYINASIIMQLLTVAVPRLEQLAKEGEEGRKMIGQWIRYGTVILGFLQAAGLYFGLRGMAAVNEPGLFSFVIITLSFTAGTAFLMWLGEQITEFGIGNGISLIIFAGIVSQAPKGILALYGSASTTQFSANPIFKAIQILLILAVFLAIIVAVVWVQQAERRIPVQYAKRIVGQKMYGGQKTHIPIKVNLAGVIPIIFAMSFVMLPPTVIGLLNPQPTNEILKAIVNELKNANSSPWFIPITAALVVFFTFFYSMIQFNPVEIANNLKKSAGYIPGIRPGKPTSEYIQKVLLRITWFSSFFLAFITILPSILYAVTKLNGVWFAGTSVLILVGVALDTVKQIESQMLMRHYKGFLE